MLRAFDVGLILHAGNVKDAFEEMRQPRINFLIVDCLMPGGSTTGPMWAVNLEGANVSFADASEANMKEANLRGADLTGTDITATDLEEPNFLNSTVKDTLISTGIAQSEDDLRNGLQNARKPC